MLLRRSILPRTISDACVALFTLCIIPTVYYFELFVVLPHYYPQWGFWYLSHFLSGTFILFNVCSNYMAIVICDTSIKGRLLRTVGQHLKFCSVCECLAPPRSWHCNVCNICILKRDHHCKFTGCCIGHHNLRYFIMFIAYIFIATIYASYYNLFYVLDVTPFGTWHTLVKILFPLAFLFIQFSWEQLCLFLMVVILLGGVFCGVLLYYHSSLILKGVVTHERQQKLSPYDYGRKQNVVEALGERWYLVWVSPFLESKLPHDGVDWDVKSSNKAK